MYNINIKGGKSMNEFDDNNVVREISENNSFLVKVFLWMFMGLFATGIVSFVTYSTGYINSLALSGGFGIVLIVELLVVILFSLLFRKLSPFWASILFFIYAIVNGLTLSTIYVIYELSSIMLVFFATAIFFGILALIGYKTDKDLTKLGTILTVALIVALIVSIINIFVGATIIDIILDWVIIAIFAGLTMYDMQRIRHYESQMPEKGYIYGAMDLYLDFINMFLRLLSLFGKSRD